MKHRVQSNGTIGYNAPNSFLSSPSQASRGIYLGIGEQGQSWGGAQRSLLVLGAPRSGKTSSLVIPNVLMADGPVVSTSTKSDVMEATAGVRSRNGWCFLYDPSGEIECPPGVERVGWSPLTTAGRWDSAVQTADAMVRSSRMMGGSGTSESHWTERAGALLAPLLHAAAVEDLSMHTVLRWIARRDGTTPLDILTSTIGDSAPATDLLAGIVTTDARELSGIWSTTSGVLAAYRTQGAMAATSAEPLDLTEFCRGPHTMYICSPGRRQHEFAPLVVAAIGDVRDATYVRQRSHPSDSMPATLFALDEVANIAPIPDLAAMVSEGAGQGLLVMACLQDLSQAEVRWGSATASGFLSLFGTTAMLPGIGDPKTLRTWSSLGGDYEAITTSLSTTVGQHGRLRPSSSRSAIRLPRYPVDALAHGTPGRAQVLAPDKTISSVQLTPAHTTERFRALMAEPTVAQRAPRDLAPPSRGADPRGR
jgi:type IV secretory pathway TraG/TraD family ATPase VirD4